MDSANLLPWQCQQIGEKLQIDHGEWDGQGGSDHLHWLTIHQPKGGAQVFVTLPPFVRSSQ